MPHPQRLLTRQEFAHERLIHHHGARSVRPQVDISEVTSPDNRETHRLEIAWIYDRTLQPDRLSASWQHDDERERARPERRRAREARRAHAWNGVDSSQQITVRPIEHRGVGPGSLAAAARLERRDDHAFEIDPALVAIQVLERSHEETRSDERHHRQCHLDDEERLARAGLGTGMSRVPDICGSVSGPVGARGADRRGSGEKESGKDRDGSRERQDAKIGRQVENHRLPACRREPDERRRRPVRERSGGRNPDRRQHQALDEHLSHDAPPTGAQCESQREFRTTRGRSCEHEVTHVRARDEEHEAGDAQQDEQRLRELPSQIRESRGRGGHDETRVFELPREPAPHAPLGLRRPAKGIEPWPSLFERRRGRSHIADT